MLKGLTYSFFFPKEIELDLKTKCVKMALREEDFSLLIVSQKYELLVVSDYQVKKKIDFMESGPERILEAVIDPIDAIFCVRIQNSKKLRIFQLVMVDFSFGC